MKKQLWSALLVLGLVALAASGAPANMRARLATVAKLPDAPGLLQFTSGGHVLAFTLQAVHVAGGSHAYQVEFVNAAPVVPVAGSAPDQPGRAAPLRRVTYPDLWAGITLTYDAPAGAILRSTYRLEPQADPATICLRYNVPVQVESDGALALAYATGVMRESAPVAWQETARGPVPVQVAYALCDAQTATGEQEVGFAVGSYDPASPLFIDPTLTWNTFLGGSGDDEADSIAVDGNGNVYVAGYSQATWGTPVRDYTGGYDTFVARLDSSGGVNWNTFLGGSGNEFEAYIAVDGTGNVYVAGYSDAAWQGTNPPVRGYTGGGDAFIARLDSNGGLTWNTFLGGSGLDYSSAIAVDGSAHVVVTGSSNAAWQGTNPPVRAYTSANDAFVARLDSDGGLTWNTFLGGSGTDEGHGIAVVAGSGDLVVAGGSNATWGAPVRAYTSSGDTFAARLSNNGGLIWNTFLGGSGTEYEGYIAVDGSGNIYLEGRSTAAWQGTNPPVRGYTAGTDAYAAKLDSSGGLTWNTFLGGSGIDDSYGIAVDKRGNIVVAGDSNAAWGAPIRAYTSGFDAFAVKLNSSGGLVWNTFLGGSGTDSGYAIAVDGNDNVYLAGLSRTTWGAPVRDYTGGSDAFIIKLPPYPFVFLPLVMR